MSVVLSFLIKTKIGRAIMVAFLLLAFVIGAYYQIRQGAFEDAKQDTLQETVKAEQERKHDDAYLQGLEAYRLCLEYLGSSSVQNAECKQLRRFH